MTQFIGVYENAFSKEYCEKVMSYFDLMKKSKNTFSRKQLGDSKLNKDDDSYFGHSEINISNCFDFLEEFNNILWQIYKEHYATKFEVLENSGTHNNYCFKVQKTPIGGGYHIWHYEAMNRNLCHRLLTWMVYLNNVEEGGETEFLYFSKRISPKQGRLLVFPPNYPWAHRGNPPLSGAKYIMTGWLEFN